MGERLSGGLFKGEGKGVGQGFLATTQTPPIAELSVLDWDEIVASVAGVDAPFMVDAQLDVTVVLKDSSKEQVVMPTGIVTNPQSDLVAIPFVEDVEHAFHWEEVEFAGSPEEEYPSGAIQQSVFERVRRIEVTEVDVDETRLH